MLVEDMMKLRNTLNLIEVHGEAVKVLSNCMYFTDQIISDIQNGKYDKESSNEEPKEKV